MKKHVPKFMYISRYLKPYKFWLLRFRHGGKRVYQESFRDDSFLTPELALQAAIYQRNLIAKKYGVDLGRHWSKCKTKDYRYVHKKPSARNSTGVIGVTLYVKDEYRVYRASISLSIGRETVKSFNCKKYGEKAAFAMAVDQRKAWEKELLTRERKEKDNMA